MNGATGVNGGLVHTGGSGAESPGVNGASGVNGTSGVNGASGVNMSIAPSSISAEELEVLCRERGRRGAARVGLLGQRHVGQVEHRDLRP